jgi:hypothetical protein
MNEEVQKSLDRQEKQNEKSQRDFAQMQVSVEDDLKDAVYEGLYSESTFTDRQMEGLQRLFTIKTRNNQGLLPRSPYAGLWPALRWHFRYWRKYGRHKAKWWEIYLHVLKDKVKHVSLVHLFHRFYDEQISTPILQERRAQGVSAGK